jgi:hypothetical protein
MDTPQPPPVVNGIPVSAELVRWIDGSTDITPSNKDTVKKLIEERCAYGLRKYNQCLMSNDGRDDVIDAMQEAGDLIQYSYKAKLNGRLGELKRQLQPLLNVLDKVLEDTRNG